MRGGRCDWGRVGIGMVKSGNPSLAAKRTSARPASRSPPSRSAAPAPRTPGPGWPRQPPASPSTGPRGTADPRCPRSQIAPDRRPRRGWVGSGRETVETRVPTCMLDGTRWGPYTRALPCMSMAVWMRCTCWPRARTLTAKWRRGRNGAEVPNPASTHSAGLRELGAEKCTWPRCPARTSP
jgi:hypothetical protein